MTDYFFLFQATGTFYNVNLMFIKKFCPALVISYYLIITSNDDDNIIKTMLVRKCFLVFQNYLLVTIPLLVILEKYCFIDFLFIYYAVFCIVFR